MPTGLERFHGHSWPYLAMGGLLVVLGLLALLFPMTATFAVETALGVVLTVAGAAGIIHAVAGRHWPGWMPTLLLGITAGAVGLLLLLFPRSGVLSLTLVVGVLLLAMGAIKGVYAAMLRRWRGSLWLGLAGVLSLVLGVLILSAWQSAALWVLGVLVGVDLIVTGTWMIGLGLAIRQLMATTH